MTDEESRELKQRARELNQRLDQLAIVPRRQLGAPRWQQTLAFGVLSVLAFLTLFYLTRQSVDIEQQSIQNGEALERQIVPLQDEIGEQEEELAELEARLQAEIVERDALIADYDIIVAQAVAGLRALCDQVEAAGQQCARVELDADLGPPAPPADG